MDYDLIVVARSMDDHTKNITQQTITSCLDTAEGKQVNVILVETNGKIVKYKGVNKYVKYEGEFRYNHALNMGLKYKKGRVQMLANNDLIFEKGWNRTDDYMRENKILSASLLSNDQRQRVYRKGNYFYNGYGIGKELTGWLIFTDVKLWDVIGELDESQKFWYSDNVYADALLKNNIEHALICNAKVVHLGSITLSKADRKVRDDYMFGDARTYKMNCHAKNTH